MADFVAVLRKTIGGLGETSPEMREKVFDKARATIEAKLRAIEPPPPAAVIDRQRQALEEAIAVVRAEFAGPPAPDEDDALTSVLADFDKPAAIAAPAPVSRHAVPAATDTPSGKAPTGPEKAAAPKPAGDPVGDMLDGPTATDRLAGDAAAPRRRAAAPAAGGGRSRAGLVAGVLGLVVLAAAAGGYFWWSGGSGGFGPTATEGPAASGSEPAAATAEDMAPPPSADEAGEEASTEQAATAEPARPAAADSQEKFTQRLMPDGSEVDEGPSGGGQPGIGEGTSVAAAAQPAQPPAAAPASPATPAPAVAPPPTGESAAIAPESAEQPAAGAAPAGQQQAAAAPQQPAAVAIGQKAIFYEERTSAAEGSAEVGSIAWSLVQESPGGELPPEPAIRAEATIPGKDVQLRMTIRRNGDKTLPASHIVEMIFLTPEGFDGGSISNVSRIAFKDTEQAPGNPLIGIPAKIADGFFLLALSDAPAETRANLALLQRQNWLDIPIVYQSGRRALLSMEKGIPGERVFEEALKAWSEAGSG